MISLIALSRLIAMETKQSKRKENHETTDPLQKSKNSSEHIPKPWRDLRVSNNRSRPESLRFSSYAREGGIPPLNLAVHAIWGAEHLCFRVAVPTRVGL